MPMKNLILILSLLCVQNLYATVDLSQAYQQALKREPIIRAQLQVQRSKSQYSQIKGAALPQISLKGEYSKLDDSGVTSSTFNSDPRALSLELKQTLFSGFQEFDQLKKSQKNIEGQETELKRTEAELFNDLVKSYLDVLYYLEELKLKEEIQKLSNDRVQFLQKRVDIGRSRRSELISAQALLASTKSELEEVRIQLASAREQFSFLTGYDDKVDLKKMEYHFKLPPIQAYLSKVADAPVVKKGKILNEQAHQDIKIARSGHYPTVDLKGNYYLDRNGSSKESDWVVSLSLTMPLFESGKTSSNVSQSVEAAQISEVDYRYQEQQLQRDVRILYSSIQLYEEQVQSFDQSVELNRKNYQVQLKEYGLGLVSNLDVLQALTQYTQSRSRLNKLQTDMTKNYYRLLTMLGGTLELN